ncbi:MAG: UDP-N-acetyl-D-mannosaminuronic acid transferase (WecB/TagA/CpsF family) [Candidatus Woesearchaeota archaeon]|jgi:UDP-N-acetyl-D-mannosaminuronic acid transferase (WecB/TagA/CpsF family)
MKQSSANLTPDKSHVTICGVRLYSGAEFPAQILERALSERTPVRIGFAASDELVRAQREVDVRHSLAKIEYLYIDGRPIYVFGRLLRKIIYYTPAHTVVNDIMFIVKPVRVLHVHWDNTHCRKSVKPFVQKKHKVCFVKEGLTTSQIITFIQKELDAYESSLDVVCCYLGTPLHHVVIANLHSSKPISYVALGSAIDVASGSLSVAPRWMQLSCLGWFHRMVQDPIRLFPRYLKDCAVFYYFVKYHILRIKK